MSLLGAGLEVDVGGSSLHGSRSSLHSAPVYGSQSSDRKRHHGHGGGVERHVDTNLEERLVERITSEVFAVLDHRIAAIVSHEMDSFRNQVLTVRCERDSLIAGGGRGVAKTDDARLPLSRLSRPPGSISTVADAPSAAWHATFGEIAQDVHNLSRYVSDLDARMDETNVWLRVQIIQSGLLTFAAADLTPRGREASVKALQDEDKILKERLRSMKGPSLETETVESDSPARFASGCRFYERPGDAVTAPLATASVANTGKTLLWCALHGGSISNGA